MDDLESVWEDAVFVGRHDVLESNEENIIPRDQDTINRIRAWLHPTDFDGEGSEYQRHVSSHLSGTGSWLLNSSSYQQWHSGDEHGMLWIRGIPGSGKSVLASSIIDELSKEQMPVLYFFFRQIIETNYSPRAAIQDWLAQVLIYSPPLQTALESYLEHVNTATQLPTPSQPRELDSISTADLWQHLRTALSHLPKAYIVVDALDEIDQTQDTDNFLRHISDLAHWRPSKVKILVTSRPVATVERVLRKEEMLRIRLDGGQVDLDIATYVQSRLAASPVPLELHGSIQAAVPGRAQGLFLYAKLAMDNILKDGVDVRVVLHELPENLHLMYSQLLHEHISKTGVSMEIQLLIMQWITHSVRPLRLIEMSDMLRSEPSFGSHDIGVAKSCVRSACGPLLELLPDETLCVIHHSLTEFLNGTTRTNSSDYPILEPGPTHNRLALLCLSHLQNGSLENVVSKPLPPGFFSVQASTEPLLDPFTRYAALNWHIHARKSRAHGTDQTHLNAVLEEFTTHAHFHNWVHLAKLPSAGSRTVTPLSMAVSFGLSDFLQILLSQPGIDCDTGAPIVLAADKGFAETVLPLIQHGANINQLDDEGYTALHRAAINNHPNVVRLLLQADCNTGSITEIRPIDHGFQPPQYTAMELACRNGHSEVVAELQEYMSTLKEIEDALQHAVKSKRTMIVQQLLKHPLANLLEHSPTPLLNEACSNRDLDTMKLLLAAGANANGGALAALASSKEAVNPDDLAQCFQLLLEAGADVNEEGPSKSYRTSLHGVADAVAAKILIEAGANVEAENCWKETPLFTCSDIGALNVLVKFGNANLEKTNSYGQTPLLSSLSQNFNSFDQTVIWNLALVDLGANVNAVDKEGNGVFHFVVKKYSELPEELVSRLCAAGADINRTNHKGEAPIHHTQIQIGRSYSFMDTVVPKRTTQFDVLVAAGARLTPPTAVISKTPLFNWISNSIRIASDQDLPDILKTLVQCGASLHVTDDRQRTLLHELVQENGSRTRIQFAIDQGLDPQAVDIDGNTLWHEAVTQRVQYAYNLSNGPAEPFNLLLQLGVSPTRSNHYGRTPLHILSSAWPSYKHEERLSKTTAFDIVLSSYPNVDIVDKDGVTPLHLASTFSEYLTKKLLRKKADPSLVTYEGCNAVHLSARSSMPNIVGMLLENLKARPESILESTINGKDSLGRSPLYYACIVGSYEAARYLIDAGAIVNSEDYEISPWKALAGHELEAKNWRSYEREKRAGAVLIADTRRPVVQGGLHQHNERIDELIKLLSANDTLTSKSVIKAIADAISYGADYTVDCLSRASSSMSINLEPDMIEKIAEIAKRKQIERERHDKPCKSCDRIHNHESSTVQRAVVQREYQKLPELLEAEGGQSESTAGSADWRSRAVYTVVSKGLASVLQHLVASGGQHLLADLTRNETQANLQSNLFGQPLPIFGQSRPSVSLSQRITEPLLLKACERPVSNMDVIRVLVEQADYDVNAQRGIEETAQDDGRSKQGDSALHVLVRGEHWWHLHEGLRYLLSHSPDLEIQDFQGMTPLSAALSRSNWFEFDKEAVTLLLQHGANVNTVDLAGNSCLAKAGLNLEMATLLLDHGAIVTHDAFIQALNSSNADLLGLLLSRGASPNIRGRSKWGKTDDCTHVYGDEYYPLHHLLSMDKYQIKSKMGHEAHERMVSMLLDHGADPCAEYDGSTILHDLVKTNKNVNVFFSTPGTSLKLESRNALGQTPLHLAFLPTSSLDQTQACNDEGRSIVELLVSRGADIRTQDNQGNNILHSTALHNSHHGSPEAFRLIVQHAPELLNRRNKEGSTPLHLTMKRSFFYTPIDLYLEKSGDLEALDGEGNSMLHLLLLGAWYVSKEEEVTGPLLHVFKHLLNKGANINARNEVGETPIYSLFRKGSVSSMMGRVPALDSLEQPVYKLLTAYGVDWQALNAKGQNLLHIVAGKPRSGRGSIFSTENPGKLAYERFKSLLELGLDARIEDDEGRTPLDIAADLGQSEILELFRE